MKRSSLKARNHAGDLSAAADSGLRS